MTDVNDHWFEPPAADLARTNARLARLPTSLQALIRHAGDALGAGDLPDAQRALAAALQGAPGQPDVARLYGLLLARLGNLAAATANFDVTLRAAPDDALGYAQYAQVRELAGDAAGARRLRERAHAVLPDSPLALADLGEDLFRHQQVEVALPLLERASALAPDYAPVHLSLGAALVSAGRAADGAAAIRQALSIEPTFGAAWLALADIKTVPFTDAELAALRDLLAGTALAEPERTAAMFVLARALEDRASHADAYALLVEANRRRATEVGPWDAAAFLARMQQTEFAFANPHAVAGDAALGGEAIFIVGMPRSGTTLVEQILAAHPEVDGAGELGELAQVLTEESTQRRQRYPEWVPQATAGDWRRLGQRYLELTRRHRGGGRFFTDKMPNNWQALGAIRAMLPGAHIIACRRDPLENCWSCFKQYFPRGWEFTCDLAQLATFWRAQDAAAAGWSARAPEYVRLQDYAALASAPADEIRALLAFCGLGFDPACLAFHQAPRKVHTLSAAQVNQPIHAPSRTAAAYGALLDPLRLALGLAPAADAQP